MKLKCAMCVGTFSLDEAKHSDKRVICPLCGAVNDLPKFADSDDPLPCLQPTGAEWELPAGKNTIGGISQYVRADGSGSYTREEWLKLFKVDPEIGFQYMRSGAAARERDDDFDIGGRRRKR